MALDARVLALEQQLAELRQEHERELQSLRTAVAALQQQVSTSTARHFPLGADILDGIVSGLSRECDGNVDDLGVVTVTSSAPQSDSESFAARNVADVRADSYFWSAHREKYDDIPDGPNNWVCYDFGRRRVAPTHYTIRSFAYLGPGGPHLRAWTVEASADGNCWTEIDRREGNVQLNDFGGTATFQVSKNGVWRCIRLVNIGRNHFGDNCLCIGAFEIFGVLIE
jgi:hypothetical protein